MEHLSLGRVEDEGWFGLVCGVWVLLVFAIVFGVVLNVPSAGESGTIYIRADGSIDPPTAPIFTTDNVTCTFKDNIYDSIVVERSNIVVDGAGHTVQGLGSGNGFELSNNVTIRNTNIRGFSWGLYLRSSYSTILGNNIKDNGGGVYLGYGLENNTIPGNKITNSSDVGVYVEYSCYNNTISGDNITNNGADISSSTAFNNNIVSGNNLANNGVGVDLYSASGNIFFGNNITNHSFWGG